MLFLCRLTNHKSRITELNMLAIQAKLRYNYLS